MGGENQAVSAAAAHPETSAADPSAAYQLGGASPSTLTSPGARDAAASSATVEGTGTEVPSPGPPPGSVQVVNSNVSSAAHIVAPGGEASGRSISALSPEGAPGLTDAGHGGDSSKPGEAPASKETSVADPVASDRQKNWGTAGTAEQEAKLSTGTLPLKPDLDDGKSTPAGTTSSGAVSRTTEGQPGGAGANSEEANSREEPPETQGHVCFDRCDCVPVIAGGVAAFLVCFAMVSLAALLMSTVFSKGFFSPVFFRGGGYAILLASALGLTAGGLLGGLVRPCWPRILYCGGGLMAFAAAFVFLGKRGAAVGAVGGLVTGGSIGALIVPAPLSVALGCVVGFLLGLVFGFAPIFRELKMNSRYIRYGLENSQQSREGSMGSSTLRTDSFYTAAGRRSPSRMFSSPTRPATLRSNGSLSYEIDNDKRRADSLPFPIS
ncbi:transmembrane domain protein [Cystoisospora suis]|uniref:Transmembrane domain protein n=1 Tax=Cystoisospora suis TaxID=483139 RepID=A0A2C6LDR3_9APIC|nr:transmembrane domain protein [Cystoisospora suis]